jgi:hypothetical protein
MTQQADLAAQIIGVKGDVLRVGANPQPSNELSISISNKGEAIISEERVPPNLYLNGSLGVGDAALFSRKEDARASTITSPDKWQCDWEFPSDGSFRLKIYSFEDTLFEKGESIKITFSSVISQTAPGKAVLSFSSELSDIPQPLEISKEANIRDIIYFKSEPEEGVRNLPGDTVMLKWRTNQLINRTLNQDSNSTPLPADFSKDEGTKRISVSGSMTFRLSGHNGTERVGRDLKVSVLEPGWRVLVNTIFEGDPGYPSPANDDEVQALKRLERKFSLEPTILFNANNVSIYAVFRYFFPEEERAFLFQTTNPFGPWTLIETSVLDPSADNRIPEGFSTSPGVYANDKLWLVGGSQVDPDIVSNQVWCLDPKENTWKNLGAAGWSPRMGHAVLKFNDKGNEKIWVMGGRDAAGNALNDVWTLDVSKKEWTPQGARVSWNPRCMFNPAVLNDQIWLYGGAQEPFADKLFDDVHLYQNGVWTRKEIIGVISETSVKPIASCLQEFKGRLYLFGKFKTIAAGDKSEEVNPLAYSLTNPSTNTWSSISNEGLKDWGGDTTFSYQVVNFKNMMLIARALSYEQPNPVMKVYVPDRTA